MQPVNFLGHTIGSMSNGKSVVFKDDVNIGQFTNESDAKFWIICLNITLAHVEEVKRDYYSKACNGGYLELDDKRLSPVIVATETNKGELVMDDDKIHLSVQFWPKLIAPTNQPMENADKTISWLLMVLR